MNFPFKFYLKKNRLDSVVEKYNFKMSLLFFKEVK